MPTGWISRFCYVEQSRAYFRATADNPRLVDTLANRGDHASVPVNTTVLLVRSREVNDLLQVDPPFNGYSGIDIACLDFVKLTSLAHCLGAGSVSVSAEADTAAGPLVLSTVPEPMLAALEVLTTVEVEVLATRWATTDEFRMDRMDRDYAIDIIEGLRAVIRRRAQLGTEGDYKVVAATSDIALAAAMKLPDGWRFPP